MTASAYEQMIGERKPLAEMSSDERLFHAGFIAPWIKREFAHLFARQQPMELPWWLKADGVEPEPEEWRSFREGTYEVSSFGNVRRAVPGISTYVGRPVRPSRGATGYQQIAIIIGGKSLRLYIHRMVAEAFIGPCPPGHVVNHLDGNKSNSRRGNLEYVTQRQNVQHALTMLPPRVRGPTKPRPPKTGPQTGDAHWSRRRPELVARGERMGASKLTEEQVLEMKRRLADGEAQKVLASEFGISVAQMSRIARGLRWAHVVVPS